MLAVFAVPVCLEKSEDTTVDVEDLLDDFLPKEHVRKLRDQATEEMQHLLEDMDLETQELQAVSDVLEKVWRQQDPEAVLLSESLSKTLSLLEFSSVVDRLEESDAELASVNYTLLEVELKNALFVDKVQVLKDRLAEAKDLRDIRHADKTAQFAQHEEEFGVSVDGRRDVEDGVSAREEFYGWLDDMAGVLQSKALERQSTWTSESDAFLTNSSATEEEYVAVVTLLEEAKIITEKEESTVNTWNEMLRWEDTNRVQEQALLMEDELAVLKNVNLDEVQELLEKAIEKCRCQTSLGEVLLSNPDFLPSEEEKAEQADTWSEASENDCVELLESHETAKLSGDQILCWKAAQDYIGAKPIFLRS